MSKRFHALVPVKETAGAKQRLTTVLDGAQRVQLVHCMLRDVLQALESAQCVASITVLSRDAKLGEIARQFGADIISEPEHSDLRSAISWGVRQLAADSKRDILVLAGDLPHANACAIDTLIEQHDSEDMISIITDEDNLGTNALAFRFNQDMCFFFGENSAQLHQDEAVRLNKRVNRYADKTLSLDLDTPADLDRVARNAHECWTKHWLDELNNIPITAHRALA